MGFIAWIIVGLIAGCIAKFIMKEDHGWVATILIGIVGGVIGGWIMDFFGKTGTTGFNIWSIFVAALGACVLLFLLGLIKKK